MSAPPVPVLHPFLGQDIPQLVADQARLRPNHPFLVWHPFEDEPRRWSYAGFAREVESIAAGMHARGVRPGDRILIHLDNCPELLLAWFAAARLGAVGVTTNARSSIDELNYFTGHAAVVGAVTQPAFAEMVSAVLEPGRWMVVTGHDAGRPADPGRRPAGTDRFETLRGDPADLPRRPADPMAPIGIQYTSGTTSRPMGVVWTHANALWGARVNRRSRNAS